MRKVMQSLKQNLSVDFGLQPVCLPQLENIPPSLSVRASEARRKLPTRSTLAPSDREKAKVTNFRAFVARVMEKLNEPEVIPDPPISLAQWLPSDPTDAERTARRQQAKKLQSAVMQWQLDAGVSKSKADLQAITWRGKFKRAPEGKFSLDAAKTMCRLLEVLAATRSGDQLSANADLSKRVVNLLDAMIANPIVRARCLAVATAEKPADAPHAVQTLYEMELAARSMPT